MLAIKLAGGSQRASGVTSFKSSIMVTMDDWGFVGQLQGSESILVYCFTSSLCCIKVHYTSLSDCMSAVLRIESDPSVLLREATPESLSV